MLLGTITAAQASQYLRMPLSGATTTWSASPGTVGSSAGDTVATNGSGSAAASFSNSGSTYLAQTSVYFDATGLNPETYYIDALASDIIDLNGQTFTVNLLAGETINFVAALGNSQTSNGGGLTVSGGGTVSFSSTGQYSSGMDIGALDIGGSTVTLPNNVAFGLSGTSGVSYSSISLDGGSTLQLGSGTAIGSLADGTSAPITVNDQSSVIRLGGSGETASLTPIFSGASGIVNINTNGGTLNVYGNEAGGSAGSNIPLSVNDTAGTGTLNLYGGENASAGGNDYSGSVLTLAAGTINLHLDNGNQSLSDVTMTGGTISGTANTGNVVMSGASQLTATNLAVNSLTMSGTAVFSGVIDITNDLNLTDTAAFMPSASSQAIVGGNLYANTGAPQYVVNFDGTNSSTISGSGSLDVSNLQVNLRLSAGTYSTGSHSLVVATGGLSGAPSAAPQWNIRGIFLDPGHAIPATGNEVALSLAQSGNNLILALTIDQALYVTTSVSTYYMVPPITPAPTPSPTPTPTPPPASPPIEITTPPSQTTTNAPITLPATSGGLRLTYTVLSGPARTAGNIVTLTGAPGVVTIQANETGASSKTLTFTVFEPNSLTNVSVRGQVTSAQPIIAGLVLGGTNTKSILFRAVGPSLAGFGISGALATPSIQLFSSQGSILDSDSVWGGSAALAAIFAQVGAFSLPAASLDSAGTTTLSPGAYTLVVTGGNSTGVALAEVYDTSTDPLLDALQIINYSARGEVGPGPNVLILGFAVRGSQPMPVLIRGVGPALAAFGLSGALAQPLLTLIDSTGKMIAKNKGWNTPTQVDSDYPAQISAAVSAATLSSGAFPLAAGSADSAILITLPPGNYSAEVSSGDGTTGVALAEVYNP